tara:strand:- start:66 stop:365 length:300 start_codon:yes stop_codon:yes gene_type:complete
MAKEPKMDPGPNNVSNTIPLTIGGNTNGKNTMNKTIFFHLNSVRERKYASGIPNTHEINTLPIEVPTDVIIAEITSSLMILGTMVPSAFQNNNETTGAM